MSSKKPTALILGGLHEGMMRVLLHHLLEDDLVSHVRMVDKALIIPSASIFLTFVDDKTKHLLKTDPRVEYKQANLALDESCARVFEPPSGGAYDWVFDTSGDSAMGADSHQAHYELIAKLAAPLAKAALRNGGVKAYVRLIRPPFRADHVKAETPLTEDMADCLPSIRSGLWQFEACRALASHPDLNLVIARRALPYGPHIISESTGRLLIAQIYRFIGQKRALTGNRIELTLAVEVLWSADQRRHTIHGTDLARGLVALAEWMSPLGRKQADALAASPLPPCRPLPSYAGWDSTGDAATPFDAEELPGLAPRTAMMHAPLFNIVDDGDTRAGAYNRVLADVVGIDSGHFNSLISAYARMNLRDVLDEAYEMHSEAWSEMLAASDPPVPNSPLNPKVPLEMLKDRHITLDGSKMRRIVGWKPIHPEVTRELIEEAYKSWRAEPGAWPKCPTRAQLVAAGKLPKA